jgi:hypothetical protein
MFNFLKRKSIRVVTTKGTFNMRKGDVLLIGGNLAETEMKKFREKVSGMVGEGTTVWLMGTDFEVHGVLSAKGKE